MAGDLKLWQGSDVAVGQNVKFERKGGWFITKAQALFAGIFVLILILLAILLTKYLTEESLKVKEPEKESISASSYQDNIHPISYELLFNHSSNKFSGEMSLIFNLENSTDKIILSFNGENVFSPYLQAVNNSDNSSSELGIKSIEYHKEGNIVIIEPSEILTAGTSYNLTLKFLGYINAEEKGVYKIPYKYAVNSSFLEDRWVIGTSLAPAYCSLVFPCINNTSERSSFRLKLLREKDIVTVSNIMQKATMDVPEFPDMELDDYEWTPLLPHSSFSYFILPEYKVKTIQGSVPGLNIWYPPHLENTTTPIAEAASSLIVFYNDYFNSSLPIQRLSIVVIDGIVSDPPGTLGVIPISSELLYLTENEAFKREEKLFYFLARKLCNQWLGNVVKFKSWSDNWLEEGLALYMADLAASQNLLSYDVSTFMTLVQEKALYEERFMNTDHFHTIPGSLGRKKDMYSPYKGAFLFHMISIIVQTNFFKEALQMYIEKWKFNEAEPRNLWECFNSVQNKVDIRKFMKSWHKKGYPIVTVDYENETLYLEQIPVSVRSNKEATNLWKIPITYTTEEEFDFDHTNIKAWLEEEKNISIQINKDFNESWIILNPHYAGFFRTKYSQPLWTKIEKGLKEDSNSFPSTVKAELLDDSFSLTNYGLLDCDIPLNLSLYIQDETHITPWVTLMKHIKYISLFLDNNETDYNNLKFYLENQIGKAFSALGYSRVNQETPIEKHLRAEILQWSCRYELSNGCNKWAEESFRKWLNESNMSGNIKTLNPELRKIAYCYGNRLYENNTFENLINESRKNIFDPQEEFDILRSLTCTDDMEELNSILEWSVDLNDPFFSAKRTVEIWLSLKEIPRNSQSAFEFVKSNWPSILDKFKKESEILRAILEGCTYAFTEENHLSDLKQLQVLVEPPSHENDIVKNILDNIIEKVTYNMNWRKNNLMCVSHWFSNFNNGNLTLNHLKI